MISKCGRRKPISGSWRQFVDTAEGMTSVYFIDSINHREAAGAVRNRHAEQFCPQTWLQAAENYKDVYCSYSGNKHVVILKEIVYILNIQQSIILKHLSGRQPLTAQ